MDKKIEYIRKIENVDNISVNTKYYRGSQSSTSLAFLIGLASEIVPKNEVFNSLCDAFAGNNVKTSYVDLPHKDEFFLNKEIALDALQKSAIRFNSVMMDQKRTMSNVYICGFSTSAWLAMNIAMRRPEITNFILISPPHNRYDLNFLSPCPIPGLIVHGTYDSTVPQPIVIELVSKLNKNCIVHNGVHFKEIEGANHHFIDKTQELKSVVSEYIQNQNKMIDTNLKV